MLMHAENKPDGEPGGGRARAVGAVGGSARDAAASGVAMSDRAGRCGRRDESADRGRVSDRCEDRGAVARAIYPERTASNTAEQTGRDDAVELPADGRS